MDKGIAVIAREAGWRFRAVLRPKRFFRRQELMRLYSNMHRVLMDINVTYMTLYMLTKYYFYVVANIRRIDSSKYLE